MSAWKDALTDPIVILGLLLFGAGAFICYTRWNGKGKATPFPLGVAMPF